MVSPPNFIFAMTQQPWDTEVSEARNFSALPSERLNQLFKYLSPFHEILEAVECGAGR